MMWRRITDDNDDDDDQDHYSEDEVGNERWRMRMMM
jgi:hypothetical protein